MLSEGILTMRTMFATCVLTILGGLCYFTAIGALHR